MPKFKPQYRRLLFIDKKLREGTFPNCSGLAREWEVSAKTIQRDIDYMKYELDAPIEYDSVKHGYYYTEGNFSLPAMSISESDLFAVCIAQNALRQFRNTPLHTQLASVFAKIQDSLPEKTAVQPSWFDERILLFPEPSTVINPAVWQEIATALRNNMRLRITHCAPGMRNCTERTVDPYYLVNHKGEWYLSSYCHERKSIRTFAVSRLAAAKMLDEGFTMPAGMNSDKLFGDQLGIIWKKEFHEVKIRFDSAVAPYILERKWHPRQSVKKNKDGSIVLSFSTNHMNEVKDWILSWGPRARVLAPKDLVTKVKDELKGSLKNYRE